MNYTEYSTERKKLLNWADAECQWNVELGRKLTALTRKFRSSNRISFDGKSVSRNTRFTARDANVEKISRNKKDEYIKLCEEGYFDRDIALKFNISNNNMTKLKKFWNVSRTEIIISLVARTMKDDYLELKKSGLNDRDISKVLKIPSSYLSVAKGIWNKNERSD